VVGKTVCAVCAVKEGQTEAETVAATINYQGKTYAFCSADEKAEFINQPSSYADAR
jgi:YHS domain-containing protein